MISAQNDTKEKFLAGFKGHEHTDGSAHIDKVYNEARIALSELSFPTTRHEAWKYTRVGRIANANWKFQQINEAVDMTSHQVEDVGSKLVFVNGYYREDLSQIKAEDGITVLSMSDAKDEMKDVFTSVYGQQADHSNEIFTSLNTRFACGGAFIHVAKDVSMEKPIQIAHHIIGDDVAAMSRNIIAIEQNAEAQVVMTSSGDARQFCNSVTEISVAENASLHIDKFQMESLGAFYIETIQVDQKSNSRFHINTITRDCGWVRNNLNIVVDGENCETNLYSVYSPRESQHIDNHTVVDHLRPNCESNELYKGIIYDKATGVFNGKVFVRQAAQKTNAFQQNANIIMTDDGTMNSKPELEIYADDVKCSHGSTTGQFDEEAVFYLKARGISDATAREMLVDAFSGEVMEAVKFLPTSMLSESVL